MSPPPMTPDGAAPGQATEPPATPAAPAQPRAGIASAVGSRLAAILLGAACVAWSAAPLLHTGLAQTALVIAIVAVTAGALRLATADIPQPEGQFYLPGYLQAWLTFLSVLRTLAWEETAVVAILWLEVQHSLRPWPTAALGAGLFAYLVATHIAESGAEAVPLLRRHARLFVAGACLLALGAGFAMIPATAPGAGSALLRVLAAAAVIAAAALVLPG